VTTQSIVIEGNKLQGGFSLVGRQAFVARRDLDDAINRHIDRALL